MGAIREKYSDLPPTFPCCSIPYNPILLSLIIYES